MEADLRPRLAADLAEMLEFGAEEVLLHAKGMLAKVVLGPKVSTRSDLGPLHGPGIEVIVRLVPGDSPVRAVVKMGPSEALGELVSQVLNENQLVVENTL